MKRIFILLLGVVFFTACQSDPRYKTVDLQTIEAKPVDSAFIKIGSTTVNDNLKVEIYKSKDTLRVGYSPLFFRVLNNQGSIINNAPLFIAPYMAMGEGGHGGHGAPALQPTYNEKNQMYEGGAFFSMAGSWEINFVINGKDAVIDGILINNKMGNDDLMNIDENYSVALIKSEDWKPGENEIFLLITEGIDDFKRFAKVDSLLVTVTPTLEADSLKRPTDTLKSIGNGLYTGKINLPKPGMWMIHYSVNRGLIPLIENKELKKQL